MNDFSTQFFFISVLIAHLGFYTYLLRQYHRTFKKNFSFLNQFPFELFQQPTVDLFTGSLLLFLTTLSSFMYFMYKTTTYFSFFNYIFLFILTMIALSYALLFYIKPIKIELFLFNSTLFSTMLLAFYGWSSYVMIQLSFYSMIPLNVWVSSFFFFIMVVFIFNPKLKQWSMLENVGNNEKPLYQRPKIFILALTQWLMMFSLVAYTIVLQIVSTI